MKRALLAVGLCLALLLALTGCRAGTAQTPQPASPAPATPTASTATATADPAPTATRTAQPETATAAPEPALCSPLSGVALEDLPGMVVNPYHPPPLGSDDPHQGVDFAERLNGDGAAVEGMPVQVVLAGRVAGVIADRFPYGNALLVETRLEDMGGARPAQVQLPTQGPTLEARSALTCPASAAPVWADPAWADPAWADPGRADPGRADPAWDTEDRSIYLMYAHMKEKPAVEAGDPVQCGQVVGAIGSSGNALNPHLHLEARVGPAGARFDSLAHYDSSATSEEMANYCLWRVSGVFQHFDPLPLLSALP